MIGRKLILMLIVLITMTVSLSAGITRKDAENIVLLQILSNDIGKVDVYSLSTLLNSGDKILISDRQLNCPYFQNWVFLVDDFVRASWAHPCRYIFVNEANGNYQIINETMPPFDMSYYEIISEMQFNLENYLVTDPNATIENSREPNDHLYAVLINGGICSTFNDVRFWNDLSAIYCTLTQVYGYKHENIYVHSTDGLIDNNYGRLDLDQVLPYTNDIDHGAFKDDIEDTFDTLANEMDSHDQLFVYVTDHGDTQNRIQLWGNDTINTLELNTMLNSIESSEIVVVMGQCYSGGFISNPVNVTGSHRTIFTSTNASEGSYLELWITGGNYDEFVFYWTTAARGYFPGLRPWELSEYEVDEFPFNNYFNYGPTHPAAYDPDLNGDGFIQMEEAFDYANNFDTWSPEGYYNTSYPVGHPGHIYAGCDEHPCSSQNIGFQEDLLCLTGITGIIENSQNVSGKFLLSEIGIQIEDGVSLSISNGSSFYLSNQSKIIADELSSLNIGNLVNFYGENATLIADPPLIPETIPGNKIEINGNLIIGSEINLNIENDNYWDGMYIYDCPYMITMNYPTINNCNLYSEGTMMTINDGSLTNCEISHYGQDLEIYDSQLTNSIIYANEPDPLEQSSFVFNNGSIVNSDNAKTAITISSYYDFQINENYINSLGSAIYLYESGYGQENQIKNNELNGTGTYFGVRLYHSYAQIEGHNTITNKQIGVVGLNNCQISMNGSNYSPYQIIHNNNFDELVFTHDSFPYSFHYNQIFDDDDHSYYLLKCADHGYSRAHNVEYNYWGVNFEPTQDFYPDAQYFDYIPQWNPGRGISDITDSLFTEAKDSEESGNYNAARLIYMDIIETYPENEYAVASAKELLALAVKDNQDYSDLQTYYNSLNCDGEMQEIIIDMANYCEVGMENYETAIEYYEDIIINPPSLQDSIFAVIDAGYTYLLMENNARPGYVGSIPELKPLSRQEFEVQRDQLVIQLLENVDENGDSSNIPSVISICNYPNPFNPETTISFSLPEESDIEISIYNIKGQQVKRLVNDRYERGRHSVVWCGDDERGRKVGSGVYFYSMEVNGKRHKIRKCLLLK